VTANTIVAPNGLTVADTVREDTSTGLHSLAQFSSIVFPDNVGYTVSVYVKNLSGTRFFWMESRSKTPTFPQVYFNLQTGTVAATANGATGTITALANGWYRCTLSANSLTGTFDAGLNAGLAVTADFLGRTYTGDNTSSVALWGAQLEQSAFATDYIPNASTTVSASAGADDLQLADTVLPSTSGPLLYLADLPNQVYQNGISQRVLNGGFTVIINDQTGVSSVNGVGGSAAITGLSSSGARRIAMLYTPGAATRLSVNGSAVAVGTDVGTGYFASTTYIGNRSAFDRPFNGSLGIVAIYRASPSDAQLQAMSAL
jgi:hypothetical protein